MSARTLLRSFAGGEITPELFGRLDLAKYQTGLALCRNFQVLPHGPATRRPGFRYVAEVRDSTKRVRLIPFAFSADQTVMLEFGHLYVRFHVAGATLLEANVAVASVVGNTVSTSAPHAYSTGDDVYVGGRFARVTVTGATTFTTADRWGASFNPSPSATTAARVYTVATPYVEGDLFGLRYAQDNDVLTLVHPGYAARELRRLGPANWSLTTVSFAPSMTVPAGVGVVATMPTPTTPSPQSYVVTAVAADGVTESLASAVVSASNNLSIAGNYNTVSWGAVGGASRYNVYKQKGGAFGYIGQTTSLSIVDDNVLPDTAKTPPENIYTLNASAGDYPSAVTYHEQRRWFAGTANAPQSVWATRNGTQSNLTSSLPSRDDDGMSFRIASRQQNAVRHLLPLSDLIALTVGGEFRIFADGAPNITPTSLSVKPQGYSGSSEVQPALTSGSILFVQGQGARLRELAYNWQQSSYASIDITIMAPHLFDGHAITDLAYVRAPEPTVWAVRSDGALLGMTYVPEQQVYAWHQHATSGSFESVAVVTEGSEDVLYALVQRTVNGRSVRYVERLESRFFASQEDAFFVDCGATYSGAPASSIGGLYHLEGKTVVVLADGATEAPKTVTNGSVTLEVASSKVHVGLPYASDLQTLPLAFEGAPAGGQGMRKNANGVRMRVSQSSVVLAGPSFSRLTEYPARDVSDILGDPPALTTGELRFAIGPSWGSDAAVCVRQEQPLPLTLMSMVVDVAVGG